MNLWRAYSRWIDRLGQRVNDWAFRKTASLLGVPKDTIEEILRERDE